MQVDLAEALDDLEQEARLVQLAIVLSKSNFSSVSRMFGLKCWM